MLIKLDKKNFEYVENIDMSELCITSAARVEKETYDAISVETTKAKGNKCPVCWKISITSCPRHNSNNA